MEWSGDEDDHDQAKSETHEKILAGLSVDEPKWKRLESVPISPSHIQM